MTEPRPIGPSREWATFPDPGEEGRVWQVDVTFLASSWHCIFGAGCQGVLTEPAPELVQGCCSYGAHFADRKDRDRVVRAARRLRDDEWQHARVGRTKGVFARSGKDAWRTRLVGDACVFLNRPGFPGGAGCALHLHAARTDRHHTELKPEVCWQLPLRREDREEDDGTVTSVLSEFDRRGWGEGGDDFAWWCTEAPEAFGGREPVYRSLEPELRRMLGDVLFERVAAYLDERRRSGVPPVRHPAEAPVTFRRGPR
ncbi:MAG: hypothetical protein M5U14_05735 [Acidimicrobiia bacterium]|nr:hypothetical protein [Acidimicrobiia bacterium]